MGKVLCVIIWAALCLGFALIPEIIMYFCWGLIEPESVLEKILTLALFWVGGGSLSIIFAMLGIVGFIGGLTAIADW